MLLILTRGSGQAPWIRKHTGCTWIANFLGVLWGAVMEQHPKASPLTLGKQHSQVTKTSRGWQRKDNSRPISQRQMPKS